MSDPLTALMHAVQVMNLLKTLIMKTLREREETTIGGGYSPMSSCSSPRQTDEEIDSHHEMNTSSELRGPPSGHDEQVNNRASSESEEVESLGEIEECFSEQMDENDDTRNGLRGELKGDSQIIEHAANPRSGSIPKKESAIVIYDRRRISSSRLSTSNEDDSGVSSIETYVEVDKKSSLRL